MTRRLPPLGALRAFEAAARHLSFTKAADELHVTQAAVSQQVKTLEEALGLKLFNRYNRRLALTDAGQYYLPPLRDAFDTMAVATQRLRSQEARQLRVTSLSSFAIKWLIPRLPRFHEVEPEIEPMISTSYQLVDFGSDNVDVAIRLGRGQYPELHSELLMHDWAFPVCSPRLQDRLRKLRNPSDLRHHMLLHDATISRDRGAPNWRNWLRQAQVTNIDADRGPAFGDTAMAIQAAIAGQGVALGRRSLVSSDLLAGHLVRPFGPDMKTRYSWYFVCPPASLERRSVQAFRHWLREEIAREAPVGAAGQASA
jgi:LysR family glycine cleavage system transcriptional activator